MKLESILESVDWQLINGSSKATITGIALNSNEVRSGYLFVALKGAQTNGHLFISDALRRGAAAVAITNPETIVAEKCNLVSVDGSADTLARLAHNFYGRPDCRLIGITGTNGKTTTSYLVRYFLERKGIRTGLIGTVAYEFESVAIPAERTTPDVFKLYRLIWQMKQSGAQAIVMEVSSHALHQNRVGFLTFDIAAFTNLTQDHLDYHHSMEEYFEVKKSIFDSLVEVSKDDIKYQAVVSIDDEWGRKLKRELDDRKIPVTTFGINSEAEYRAEDIHVNTGGSTFELHKMGVNCGKVNLNLLGRHNVANYLGAAAISDSLKVSDSEQVDEALNVPNAPGRLEFIPNNLGIVIVVDYAHTDDALKKTLLCLREITENNLWVVFGCGGERDKLKRHRMGAVAEKFADKVILTSDNPRTEKPEQIIADIQKGMNKNKEDVLIKRSEAVASAISNAKPGDVVLLAGKGHEAYQEINRVFYDYDDRAEARKVVAELEKRSGGTMPSAF